MNDDYTPGPLPEHDHTLSIPPAFYKDEWKHHLCYFTSTVHAYARTEVAREVAKERERCARVCEAIVARDEYAYADECAAAIRASRAAGDQSAG